MSRSTLCNDSVKRLLRNILGLKVIEREHICCGGTPKLAFFEIPMKLALFPRERLASGALECELDYLVNLCRLGEFNFSAYIHLYPFKLKDFPSLINQAIDGNKHKRGEGSYRKTMRIWFYLCLYPEKFKTP